MIRVDEEDPVGEIEPSFPYRDVTVRRGVDFKDNYDIQSEIGRGKFGTVYHCKEKTTGLQLAAKVVTTTRKEDRRAVEREVEIMRRLQHPRLIQLYDAIDTGKQIYVILELIQGGELFERVIDDDFVLTERSCAVFVRQICEGMEFVHAQHILHLDMKPENILCLTKEGNRIKIIDFGLARNYDPRKKLQVLFGTPEFVAPEVVNFDQIGFGTDMWSIGVICYVLLSGLSPFMGDTDVETMANVTIAKYDFDHDAFTEISEDAKDFIRCLLVKDKEKRATATQCRSHRWLQFKSRTPEKIVTAEPEPANVSKPKDAKSNKTRTNNEPETIVESKPSSSSARNELDVTKDNLRTFVERWREHPDSPYAIEQDDGYSSTWDYRANTISGDNNLELASLGGQSPSPCGSVCSSPSEVSIARTESNNRSLGVPGNVVLGLERRASEGYAAMSGHRRDQAAQIVLAEEIIKLSEHLRNLATGKRTRPDDDRDSTNGTNEGRRKLRDDDDDEEEDEKRSNNVETNATIVDRRNIVKIIPSITTENNVNVDRNEIAEKLSNITERRKIRGTTFNGHRNRDRTDDDSTIIVGSKRSPSTSVGTKRRSEREVSSTVSSGSDRRETTIDHSRLSRTALNDFRGCVTWRADDDDGTSNCNERGTSNAEMDLTPPWRRARAKHRFGETCRDVPRISNLRDIHKSLNLDEPKSTKDLLLQLLGEWDDSTRPGGVGRKSISVDWCGEESVARRSMNSLAEYFQSEQQKSTTTGVTNNASSASIHR